MTYSPPQKIVCRYGSPVFGTLVIEPEVSGHNNWTKVSPIPWYRMVPQTTFVCLFWAICHERERVVVLFDLHPCVGFVAEVSEIAGHDSVERKPQQKRSRAWQGEIENWSKLQSRS
jgi:hypothetical protein